MRLLQEERARAAAAEDSAARAAADVQNAVNGHVNAVTGAVVDAQAVAGQLSGVQEREKLRAAMRLLQEERARAAAAEAAAAGANYRRQRGAWRWR
ncbi:unnamed protein product [Effrenium voratum]|uniref:Uncharacterized protein n=1 Tax=Effrenium voratum TaxID=2562239 RepID=A0AA36HTU4_9DINO|nr:unnamed protein product [Effrenium voratum]